MAKKSFREILRLCYFSALVCVELSLIVVLDISTRMVHIVSFFWIASRSKKMTLGPWVVIG